ncbi:ORC ubiquitin ligase 1-like [Watersipora subatra]|uniref:ORC ubiquitin ligase 1-like n=1 Tax=Watersipora subatra TaxID=2589382 RepID=UPI00355C242A
MASNSNATVAFTLPISCQICLAKVKEPVCCDNNHVYCKSCIVIWTSKSKHCPTCRIPITSEKPYRQLLGGQDNNGSESNFSQPMVRKARMKSIFDSYEDEIERLTSCICRLKEDNHRLSSGKDLRVVKETPSVVPTSGGDDVSWLLEELTEAKALCSQVTQDLNRSLQENADLKVVNDALSRENDRMRYELSQRTPSKVGRFALATLETQIDRQKKEIVNLERALALSDKHIEGLRAQLRHTTDKSELAQSNGDDRKLSSAPTRSLPKALFSQLSNEGLSTGDVKKPDSSRIPPDSWEKGKSADRDVLASRNLKSLHVSSNTGSSLYSNDVSSEQSCSARWKASPVSQLLASGLTTTDTTSSLRSDSYDCISSPKRRRMYDTLSPSEFPQGQLIADKPSEAERSVVARGSSETESVFEGIEATDISMTAEYSDCLRILHKAEKNVKEKHRSLPS